MEHIKIIVTDIDGTLISSDGTLDETTKKALIKDQQKGTRVVLASGRPTSGMLPLAAELDLANFGGMIVSYNGSKVLNPATDEVLFHQPLSHEEVLSIIDHLEKFDVSMMFDDGTYLYTNNGDGYMVQHEAEMCYLKLKPIKDLREAATFTLSKVLVSATPEYLQEHHDALIAPFAGKLNCVFSAPFYLEYTAQGIDKGNALAQALEPLGYHPDAMIGFGDGHNDKSFLSYVGHAVAMGNAVDAVKDMAHFVTRSNDESGIAYALETLKII